MYQWGTFFLAHLLNGTFYARQNQLKILVRLRPRDKEHWLFMIRNFSSLIDSAVFWPIVFWQVLLSSLSNFIHFHRNLAAFILESIKDFESENLRTNSSTSNTKTVPGWWIGFLGTIETADKNNWWKRKVLWQTSINNMLMNLNSTRAFSSSSIVACSTRKSQSNSPGTRWMDGTCVGVRGQSSLIIASQRYCLDRQRGTWFSWHPF